MVSSWSMVLVRSWPTQWVSSFSTSMSWFFSACRYTCSEPFLSSKRNSLQFEALPLGVERVRKPLCVCEPNGIGWSSL